MLPIFGAKDGARMGNVAERPEALIGKPEVVAFLLLFGQPDSFQCVLGLIGRHAQAIAFVHGFAIGIPGAVREPRSLAGSQNGFNGRNQAAGRDGDFHVFPPVSVRVGFAIGDHEERPVSQLAAHMQAQAFRRPQ